MRSRIEALAERRLALVRSSDAHRAQLGATVEGLHREIAIAETVVTVVRGVRRYRALFGALAAALLLFGPSKTRRWLAGAAALAPFAIGTYRLAKGVARPQESDDSSGGAP
ncbi:MAG TPA: hypothetical protein VF139_05920 [Candidatus Polarisedimenticolaceae bacterium]